MTLSRTRRSTSTVLLALLLVLVLALQRPAEALAPGGVVLAPSAASALGLGTAAGSTAAAAAGGIAILPAAAVVAGGLLIGWGIAEASQWAWSELTSGEDPVPATLTGAGYAVDDTVACPDMTHPDMATLNCPGTSAMLVGTVSAQADGTGTDIEFDHGPYADPNTCTGNWTILLVKDNGDHIASSGGTTGCGWPSPTVVSVGGEVGPCCGNNNEFQFLAWKHDTETDWEFRRFHYDQLSGGEAAEDRQLVAQAECIDRTTNAVTTVTESTALYAPGVEPLTPGVVCPLGTHLSGLTVTRTIDGDDGTNDEVLFDATPVVPLTGTQYEDCTDGSCSLALHRVAPDGTTADCSDPAVLCVGWITDTDRHLNYRCMWGTHVVPLDDCEMFHAIDTDAQTGTATEPDGSVDSDLGTTTDIGTGPTTEAEASAGCSPWAWINPFSGGIAQGVACALEWAAVPDTAVVTQHLTTLDTQFMTKVPFAYADLIAPVVQGIPAATMSACAGNLWDLTPEDTRPGFDSVKERHGDGLLAVPCTPPSWWTPVDLLLTSMVVVGTAWGLWNIVGAAVGGPRDGGGDGDG